MRQMNLFETDNDGRLAVQIAGLSTVVRAAMNQAASRSSLSRELILDRINALSQAAGIRLTRGNSKVIGIAMLNQWLNPAEREHVPSLLAVNVFCLAVGDPAPLAAMLALHGLELMSAEDRKFRDYGKACVRERKARAAKKKIEENLE